ncbi:NAD(P)-binding protein [Peniophora sp. CONT]|nr:NAD(P)-binding protein [Peniophora sp. CONT]
MSRKTTIFLTGATGYLGGAALQLLMQNPDFSITALVRDGGKTSKLEQLGIKTVLGSLDDAALLEAEGVKADAIVHGASFNHIGSVSALLKGAKVRFEQTGKQSIFIQTSGVGAFAKMDAMGDYTSEHVLSDADPGLVSSKNPLQPLRVVNDSLVAADGEGYIRAYIIYPSIIYGTLKGPLVDARIAHAYSIAITFPVKLAIQRGQGAMVGQGLNRWPAAHIDDTAELYKLVLERGLANEAPHGAQGIYVVENGEINFGDAARQYTNILHGHGKSAKAEPEAFTAVEIEKLPSLSVFGSDVRIRADRARKLGWSPAHGIEEFNESIQEGVEAVLAGKD